MTPDSLLSGLIGAVIGGALGALIVVRAEQWRWRRENRAALRLLYYEVMANRILLEGSNATLATLGSKSVWQEQQVRIASSLNDSDLNKVAAAYVGFTGLLSTRSVMTSNKQWAEWMKTNDGAEM